MQHRFIVCLLAYVRKQNLCTYVNKTRGINRIVVRS